MIAVPPRVASAWADLRRRLGGSNHFDLLARTFFARFFDNDITGGSSDLRSSFFWMIAFLAAPGLAIPVLMSFDWEFYALAYGNDGLRIAARGDKAFYLGFSMVASGVISAVTWSSLLLDRRDCLVLGSLPVEGPRIVRAKLTALCAYILTVAVLTHAVPSLSYGFFLAAHASVGFALAGTVAHMVASCAASAFVLFAISATQGTLFAVVGARRFVALTPWLQASVVTVVLLGLLSLPVVTTSTVDTLASADTHATELILHRRGTTRTTVHQLEKVQPWILQTPPLWFLGLYESVLRTDDPVLRRLRNQALAGLGATIAITLLTYPLAYRRLVSSVAEAPEPPARHGWPSRIVDWAVLSLSRRAPVRAAAQFFIAAVRRCARQRLALALTAGATLALVSPTLFRWAPRLAELPATPSVDLLAVPFIVIFFVLVGLRIASALPADLNASWLLDAVGARPDRMRSGLWRVMFFLVVAPVSLVPSALYWAAWGPRVAALHALVCLTFGAVSSEGLLWGVDAMPCSRPWRPEHANLRKWWPAYLALFLFVSGVLPRLERMSLGSTPAIAALAGSFVLLALTLRVMHRRRRIIPESDLDEPQHVQVLNLD